MKVLVVHAPAEARPRRGATRASSTFPRRRRTSQSVCRMRWWPACAAPAEMLDLLAAHRPDVVFNACEAPLGRPDLEPNIAALMELLGVRFTGSGSADAGAVPAQGPHPCGARRDGRAGAAPERLSLHRQAGRRGRLRRHSRRIDLRGRGRLAAARARLAEPDVVEEFLPGREFVVAIGGGRRPSILDRRDALPQRATPEHLCVKVGGRERGFRQLADLLRSRARPGAARSGRRRGARWLRSRRGGYMRVDSA